MTPVDPLLSTPLHVDNHGVILHRTEAMAVAAANLTVTPLKVDIAPMLPPPASERGPRIIGYDLARAIAILGMLVEHCAQVFGPSEATGIGELLLMGMDGRASAVFVVLAGVGVSLLGRGHDAGEVRMTLLRRGSLLFLLGTLNRVVWPGDILRLFGVTMIAAGVLNALGRRALLAIAIACVAVFPVIFAAGHHVPFLSYETHWRTPYSIYVDEWGIDGFFRGLIYNGFRPVFPWAGLLIFGMWLGRLDVRRPAVRRGILKWGLVGLVTVETVSRVALHLWLAHPMGFSEDAIRSVFDVGSMPPMPPFVLSATATALVVIGLCLIAGARWSVTGIKARAARAMSSTGQMALTWYVLHILAGAVVVRYLGWHYRGGSLVAGFAIGFAAFAGMVLASALWRRRFKYGPLEYLLRVVS